MRLRVRGAATIKLYQVQISTRWSDTCISEAELSELARAKMKVDGSGVYSCILANWDFMIAIVLFWNVLAGIAHVGISSILIRRCFASSQVPSQPSRPRQEPHPPNKTMTSPAKSLIPRRHSWRLNSSHSFTDVLREVALLDSLDGNCSQNRKFVLPPVWKILRCKWSQEIWFREYWQHWP